MSDIIVTDAALPPVAGLQLSEVHVPSSVDGAPQPLIIGVPDRPCAAPTPLLVGLHTWSADFRQQVESFGPLCAQYGWLMVLPHFRGPNLASNPRATQAGGSLLAQHDIVDAVAYMTGGRDVDAGRVYLIGGSGGGHMSLLMAGKHPEIWAGVSSWCPITSLQEWHAQGNAYAPHVEAVCGGAPGASAEVDSEYLRRSPRTFITNAANTPVRISHGDKDTCIYVAQTWRTMERLLETPHRVEFYTWSGGHELLSEPGFAWLAGQVKPSELPRRLDLVSDEAKWTFWLHCAPDAPLTLAQCQAEWIEPTVLTVRLEHARDVRLRLDGFPVASVVSATRDGVPVGPETLRLDAGVLELPGAGAASWRLEFT